MHKWEYTPTFIGFDSFCNADEDDVGKYLDFRNNTEMVTDKLQKMVFSTNIFTEIVE